MATAQVLRPDEVGNVLVPAALLADADVSGSDPVEAATVDGTVILWASHSGTESPRQAEVPNRPTRSAQEIVDKARAEILLHHMLNEHEAARALGVDADRVAALRASGELLCLIDERPLFPVFQFDAVHQRLRPWVADVNRHLNADAEPWAVASWWLTPHGRLDGRSPADLLTSAREELIPVLAGVTGAQVPDAFVTSTGFDAAVTA